MLFAAHTLTRTVAVSTRSETPAAQWRTLSILRASGPLRLGELARLSRVSQPGMTRLVGSMLDAGLLDKHEDPGDSRAQLISITPAGAKAFDVWESQLGEALMPVFADLSDDDWAVLTRAAEILASVTENSEENAS